ncbi:MAG: NAD(P)/FAD-dependent oxidoreductase [Phycisphaerales bacterium JB040]
MTRPAPDVRDVTIIGAGPGGAVAAICAARAGLSVRVLERETFPRFHLGESLLPHTFEFLEGLGLGERAESLAHVPKYGAAFAMGDSEQPTLFWFPQRDAGRKSRTLNLERAHLDKLLLDAARDEGVEIREGVRVEAIESLGAGGAAVRTDTGVLSSRVLIDASGQGAVVGRHLGTRTPIEHMQRVAYFEHFRGVEHPPGEARGSSVIVMCDDGWFWLIPLDEHRTSVGLVMRPGVVRERGLRADGALRWGIERCPFVRTAMRNATGPGTNRVCADFSYACRPYAGEGYFLVGDAAVFVDPVFSTGVSLAMASGRHAAECAARVLRDPASAARVRSEYARAVDRHSAPLFAMIDRFYRHPFREFIMTGSGPLGIHNAVLSIVAGRVFPRPRLRHRWRVALLDRMIDLHERTGRLVPRHEPFRLQDCEPVAWAGADTHAGIEPKASQTALTA